MATNKDLLKEAIADAKAIRESALANAKAALEEAFTPQLKNMLSEKIQEISEEEKEEKMEEMKKEKEMYEGKEELEELNLDELLAELEGLEEEDDTLMEAEKEEDDKESVKEAKDEEEDESEEKEEDEEEEIGDMTSEEFSKVLKNEVIKILKDLDVEFTEEDDDMEMDTDMDMEDAMPGEEGEEEELDEMVDLQALLEELGVYEGDDEEKDLTEAEEELEEITLNPYKRFVNKFIKQEGDLAAKAKDDEGAFKQLLTKFQNFMKSEGITGGARNNYLKPFYTALGKKGEGAYKGGKFSAPGSSEFSGGQIGEELSEALETIETLRSEINEVNLLNAKLLYTNRIFKSKTLTESQKTKVLDTFDKATTVNEVKLIHETLNNSLNTSRKPINESKGSASQVMGTTKTKSIINENDAFSRMRELAFYSQKH